MVASRVLLSAMVAACTGHRVRVPATAAPRTRTPVMVKELNLNSWCEVDSAEHLAVVFFFATWCRSCKAVGPVYRRVSRQYPQADFFKVNFKQQSELCYNERVFSFPVVHFYLPNVGRVGRLVLKGSDDPEGKLRAQLDRFVGDDGPGSQLRLLKELRAEVLRPVVRYKNVVSALSGLANMGSLIEQSPKKNMAGLLEAIDSDEQRLGELEAIFGWLDRDGNGRLDLGDLEQAVEELRPEAAAQPTQTSITTLLLNRFREQSDSGGAEESVDLGTFVRLMTTKAVGDYTAPERELMPAFEAIDADGDGSITQEELLAAIQRLCGALPDADGCDLDQRELMQRSFGDFAIEDQQLDYERFVEMISGREPPLECEIDVVASYGSIFGDL